MTAGINGTWGRATRTPQTGFTTRVKHNRHYHGMIAVGFKTITMSMIQCIPRIYLCRSDATGAKVLSSQSPGLAASQSLIRPDKKRCHATFHVSCEHRDPNGIDCLIVDRECIPRTLSRSSKPSLLLRNQETESVPSCSTSSVCPLMSYLRRKVIQPRYFHPLNLHIN
jgi:hypothetical protein